MDLKSTCAVCTKECTQRYARCRSVAYCSKEHQAQHWNEHKQQCKILQQLLQTKDSLLMSSNTEEYEPKSSDSIPQSTKDHEEDFDRKIPDNQKFKYVGDGKFIELNKEEETLDHEGNSDQTSNAKLKEDITIPDPEIPTWEQIYISNQDDSCETDFNQNSSFKHFSSCFIAVCSEIPSNTIGNDFHIWLSAFGELSDLWIEKQNGYKNRSALALFASSDVLSQNLNGLLIKQLKNNINGQFPPKGKAEIIDILCGLASNKENIDEISSDHFALTVSELSKSTNEELKSYSLELLLILAENGNKQLQLEILKSIGDLGFLQLLGMSDLQLDDRVVNQTLKWNHITQMILIWQFIQARKEFKSSNEQKKKEILDQKEHQKPMIIFAIQ
ncbi:MAG: hypothetical protein EZS28_018103 [Streblomastix strix]|uniref:MYND-type domain-containing protein n=1 Tax=Streblomastix strix TaxID=222440 RepID=A0A5J4VUS4_9EUKA|nr:MAG: hypothetical protein EZS28_018103 [Streblomastix strix]